MVSVFFLCCRVGVSRGVISMASFGKRFRPYGIQILHMVFAIWGQGVVDKYLALLVWFGSLGFQAGGL